MEFTKKWDFSLRVTRLHENSCILGFLKEALRKIKISVGAKDRTRRKRGLAVRIGLAWAKSLTQRFGVSK